MNRIDVLKNGSSFFSNASAPAPTAPLINKNAFPAHQPKDPSSASEARQYPVPHFFEYRMRSKTYDC